MPTEIVPLHVEITSEGPEWYLAIDGMVTSPLSIGRVPREFWNHATISWVGGDFDQMTLQNFTGIGWSNLAFIQNPADSGVSLLTEWGSSLLDAVDNDFTSVENINDPSTTLGLRWVVSAGTSLPTSILIEGDFNYEHTFGREPDGAGVVPYTMRQLSGDDVSTWDAPAFISGANDNEEFIATVAYAGYDNDVEAPYYTIAVYNRDIVTGKITGEYLGADRRFMGF